MAKANHLQKSAAPQGKTRVRVEHLGPQCAWPKGEAIPTSMDEALEGGWKVTNDDISEVDGERSMAGVYSLEKKVGGGRLALRVRYRAEFTHGKPHKPEARTAKTQYVTLQLAGMASRTAA